MNRTISSIPFGCASLLARTAEMASRTISLSTPKQILHRGTSALCRLNLRLVDGSLSMSALGGEADIPNPSSDVR
jgi:hypothetical protein